MNKRCAALLVPLLPLAAVPLTACSEPECASNFDCGLYMQCTDDGLCVADERPDVMAVGIGAVRQGPGEVNEWVDTGIEAGDAHFRGVLGNAEIDDAMSLTVGRFDAAVVVTLTSRATPSWVGITIDDMAALTPGTWVISDLGGDDVIGGRTQGCDDTNGHYDEILPPVVVTVPEAPEAPADGAVVEAPVLTVEFGDEHGEGIQLGDSPGLTRGVARFRFRVTE